MFDQNFIKELWDLWKMSRGATPLLSTICTAQYICASDQEEASTKLSKCCGLLAQELLATDVPFIATTGHKHRESTAELSALACDGAPVQQPQRFNSVLEFFSSPIAMTVSPTKSFVSLA